MEETMMPARRMPVFRRGMFFPVLIASMAVAWALREFPIPLPSIRTGWGRSAAVAIAIDALPLAITLLPLAVIALAWRSRAGWTRRAVLAMLIPYAALVATSTTGRVDDLVRTVKVERAMAATLHPQRLAMRVPPEDAARRALSAGNDDFLAISGESLIVPGVENWCATEASGWMVVRNTSDGFQSRGHVGFQWEAATYARRYNAEVIARLGLDRAELSRPVDPPCGGSAESRPAPRYWPDGGPIR
jgi:hypothetical protein